jgi:hypothetical protein
MEPLRGGSAWGARATRRDGLPLGTAPALGSLRKLSAGLEIMLVIGHNVLENYGLKREFFRARILAWARSR